MGQSITELTVETLRQQGFRAEEACPGRKMPALTQIAVAVELEAVNLTEKTASLEVSVLAPAFMGAQACLEAALAVGQLLQETGGECTQGSCEFDGLTNLFRTPITVRYHGTALPGSWTERAGFYLQINGVDLRCPVSFTGTRAVEDPSDGLEDAPWEFELEEFFRPEDSEESEPEEPFVLRVFRPYQTETFLACTWVHQKRIVEKTGTRQIRKGIAGSRIVSIYA